MRFRSFSPPAALIGILSGAAAFIGPVSAQPTPAAEQTLGENLFFDTTLSQPGGQSCGSCHSASFAFTDPNKSVPTSAGVNPVLFGNRNTPTAMYSAYAPAFHFDTDARDHVGGQFLDGRAAALEDQAKAPFLNPVEMANADRASVIQKLRLSPNSPAFLSVYGSNALDDVDRAYDLLAQALAAYERTPALSPFSSKYDAWLAGKTALTTAEAHGLELFENPAKGNCMACHASRPSADGTPPLFTDFTYDNIGVPKNPGSLFYTLPAAFNPDGTAFTDLGLGRTTGNPDDDGRFKVGTLRDIALTGPYTHNGYFDTLWQVVDFYNTRDVKPPCASPFLSVADAERLGCWPAAEIPGTVNHDELGNLGLTTDEVSDIVAFLGALSDGFVVGQVAAAEPAALEIFLMGCLSLGLLTWWRQPGDRRSDSTADNET